MLCALSLDLPAVVVLRKKKIRNDKKMKIVSQLAVLRQIANINILKFLTRNNYPFDHPIVLFSCTTK